MDRRFAFVAILSLASFVFGMNGALMGEDTHQSGIYAADAVSASRLAELRTKAPARMEKLRTQLAETKARARKELSGVDKFVKERVEKRLMLCGKLLNFAAESLSRGDMDSILLANRALRDAVVFLKYFQEEFELAKVNQVVPVKISLADFGAKGDGISDDSPALARAVAKLASFNGTPVMLSIPQGRYYLKQIQKCGRYITAFPLPTLQYPRPGRDAHLILRNLKNVTIEGEDGGATFLFGNMCAGGIGIYGSRNVKLKKLTLRYVGPMFIQGSILENLPKEKAIVIKVDSGSMRPDDPRFLEPAVNPRLCCQSYDSAGRLVADASHVFWAKKYEKLGNDKYKIFIFERFTTALSKGLKFIIPCRSNTLSACMVNRSAFCSFEDVTVNNSGAAAFPSEESHALSYINCKVEPAPGFFFSSNADLGICMNNRIGPYHRNGVYMGMGDDGINIAHNGKYIARVAGNEITTWGVYEPESELAVISTETGVILAEGRCVKTDSTVWKGKTLRRLVFREPVPKSVRGYDECKMPLLNKKTLYAMQSLRKKPKSVPDAIYNLNRCGIGTLIIGTRIGNNRNNAIVLQTTSALIENCDLGPSNGIGIKMGALTIWREATNPYNIIIRDNSIHGFKRFGIGSYYAVKSGIATIDAIRDVLIENNRIVDCGKAFMFKNININEIKFSGNTVDGKAQNGPLAGGSK